MVRRVLLAMLLFAAALVPAMPAQADNVATRFEMFTPGGTPIPCGGSVDGIGSIIVKGYVKNLSFVDKTVRDRFNYGFDESGPGGRATNEAWYSLYRHHVPAGQEILAREVSQRLSPANLHKFGYGLDTGVVTCSVTATNIPATSPKVTTARPLPADPLEEIRITVLRYIDNVPITTCSSASPQTQPATGVVGRVKIKVEVRQDGASGYHSLHTHQEIPPPLVTSGPQWWEERAENLFVAGGGVWTTVTDTNAMQVDVGKVDGNESVTFHAAQGNHGEAGHLEVFCTAVV